MGYNLAFLIKSYLPAILPPQAAFRHLSLDRNKKSVCSGPLRDRAGSKNVWRRMIPWSRCTVAFLYQKKIPIFHKENGLSFPTLLHYFIYLYTFYSKFPYYDILFLVLISNNLHYQHIKNFVKIIDFFKDFELVEQTTSKSLPETNRYKNRFLYDKNLYLPGKCY